MSVSPELEGLTNFAVNTRYENLPAAVVHDLKYLLLDSIGCALAGISTDPGKMFIALSKQIGGPPESSIIGTGDKFSCVNAAMVNGQLINAIDYDALMPGAHAPPYILAPALAMAEKEGAGGRELILAAAIGFEISARIAAATPSGARFDGPEKQLKWSERWGQEAANFGATAAAGNLIRLNHNQMLNALGVAGHLCQVPTWIRYTFSEHRSMAKYGVPGWQNTGGVIAALLAEMGYLGDSTVFDPKEGFWKFVGYDSWNPENILKDLGTDWIFDKITYKPYPCCRMFQTEVECFLNIIEDNKLTPEEIENVQLFGHPTLETPAFTNREIVSIADIQFGPACIISMAANGVPKGVEWQDLEIARSPRIAEFAEKVTYHGYPDYGLKQMCRVEVVARGREFKQEKPYSQLTRLTDGDVVEKYRHNASRILTQNKIDSSINIILDLEKVDNISDLVLHITMR